MTGSEPLAGGACRDGGSGACAPLEGRELGDDRAQQDTGKNGDDEDVQEPERTHRARLEARSCVSIGHAIHSLPMNVA